MFISRSPEETFAVGYRCAGRATRGDVFALAGDLGAGKTQFVKGFVAGIGSAAEATSPTFTLIHEYSGGRLPVYHFDFYRLESAEAVLQLGFDEYLDGDGVCLIEWADRFRELLPVASRWLSFRMRSESERAIEGINEDPGA
ncbi:MAG: tRNA (adenosine(37)-N6)-threonylcarbamoyltransferase complex ATPase subunit type 1 TsaE [Verrucomicrobiota bacterium]|nr:tRNA (adenosine(37)-N6)-threonylcarbamoyltransferase complex ATPase subunit type 1 TsaE [Verrucomicrobiota bacterium]